MRAECGLTTASFGTVPARRKAAAARRTSLYTVCRVRCFLGSVRPSNTQYRPAWACKSSYIDAGHVMRRLLPVLRSRIVIRRARRLVRISRTSDTRKPLAKQHRMTSRFAGMSAANTCCIDWSLSQLLRAILTPMLLTRFCKLDHILPQDFGVVKQSQL